MNKPLTPGQRAYEERKARRQEIEDETEKGRLLQIKAQNQRLQNELSLEEGAAEIINGVVGLLNGTLVIRKVDENTFQVQPINGWR